MRLYYSIVDPYPAYRSDLAELFGVELAKCGLETEWYMANGGCDHLNISTYKNQVINRPLKLFCNGGFFAKLNYWVCDLFYLARQLVLKPDAIQCRDKYFSTLFAIVIARIIDVPFFYWCSYPFPEQDKLVANKKTGVRRFFGLAKARLRFVLLYKFICHFADHVFVQSPRMKEDMHAYGISLPKMTAVPMGVSDRIGDWIKAHPISVIPKRVVYLGSLAAVRRLDVLLEAFLLVKLQIPDAQLLLVGDGDHPSERTLLEAKVADLGLRDNVTFTGFVPMEEAWRLSASASVCVSPIYPSKVLAAASPTKLVEYMALGRPVVCNDHPEQSQIIQESKAGLCVEWSAEAFAKAISTYLLDPYVAETAGALGPAWVKANRSYPLVAKMVWSKYLEFMRPRR